MRAFVVTLTIVFVSILTGCSQDNNSTSPMIMGFTGSAIESLPLITATSRQDGPQPNISTVTTVADFFKYQCFYPGSDDFCPPNINKSAGYQSAYSFSPDNLVGIIYHGDLYSGAAKTTCSLNEGTINASSFKSHSEDQFSAPARYLLDNFSLLTCFGQPSWTTSGYVNAAFSTDPTGSYQATLTTRYRVPYLGSNEPGQTDLHQVYVSMDGARQKFLAFNSAGTRPSLSRIVLLVNPIDHKFAVKALMITPLGTVSITAIGVGGISRDTGQFNPGYYFVMYLPDRLGRISSACVNNQGGEMGADNSGCTGTGIPLSWSSSETVRSYLGITDTTEQLRLAAWLDIFEDSTLHIPSSSAFSPENNSYDRDHYFPKAIE